MREFIVDLSAAMEVWMEVVATMPNMREWVALNKTVPIEVLALLARDESGHVRAVVAMKRKLPEALQLELARDSDASVRQRLACNAKATKRVLEILANDSEGFVRERPTQRLRGLAKITFTSSCPWSLWG